MSESTRDERGRFTPQYSDEELVAAVKMHTPAGTSEVADELGVTRPSADYRLRRLEDQNRITSKKIGPARVWTVTNRSESR